MEDGKIGRRLGKKRHRLTRRAGRPAGKGRSVLVGTLEGDSATKAPVMPVRLRLSRQKGFSFQTQSIGLNGLPAVRVARPGKWGNPFIVGFDGTVEQCVTLYRQRLLERLSDRLDGPILRKNLAELRGKNLACWCKLDEPCHADVLLKLANKELGGQEP